MNALWRAILVDCFQMSRKEKINRKLISGYSQEIVMLQEKNKEDTFPSVRSLRFPKLQIFVEMVCANLQVTKRTLDDPRRSGNVVLSLGSFSGQLLSHVYGPSYKRALPVSSQFKKTDLRVSTVSTRRHALTSVRFDVFILWKIV